SLENEKLTLLNQYGDLQRLVTLKKLKKENLKVKLEEIAGALADKKSQIVDLTAELDNCRKIIEGYQGNTTPQKSGTEELHMTVRNLSTLSGLSDSSNVQQYNLVLVGRIGAGKSALGNSILRRKAFKSFQSTNLVTKEISCHKAEYNGHVYHVFDCPGIRVKGGQNCQESILKNLRLLHDSPNSKTVVLIVINIASQVTYNCNEIIFALKCNFGETYVRNHCIAVFTGGDHFDDYNQKNRMDFKTWLKKQSREVSIMLNECKDRIMLFDNKTANSAEQDIHLRNLIRLIDSLPK
ncbi:Immune-associated nucleotide-binding protein 8, partial [Bulinus truncatus]